MIVENGINGLWSSHHHFLDFQQSWVYEPQLIDGPVDIIIKQCWLKDLS